jgi:ankyrin repeat protein
VGLKRGAIPMKTTNILALVVISILITVLGMATAGENTALFRAAMNGRIECVKALLAKGAEVNTKGHGGFTPLITAAHQGETDIVKTLLAHGADVNARGDLGDTALSRATDIGHTQIITILKEAGAKE